MSEDIRKIGTDADGHPVWRVGPGQVIGGADLTSREKVVETMQKVGWESFLVNQYEVLYGPVR